MSSATPSTASTEVRAITKYVRISAFKAREVTREIQGLPVGAAMDILRFSPRKAARLVAKTLASAVANAEHNNRLSATALVVKEAVVGEGPTLKRFVAKARGSAGPIRKRTSHIRIIVAERQEEKAEAKGAKTSKGKSGKKARAEKSADKQAQEQEPKE